MIMIIINAHTITTTTNNNNNNNNDNNNIYMGLCRLYVDHGNHGS